MAEVASRDAMKIAYIAAGAGGMYCGSCIHDNTVAAALKRRGYDVMLLPTYTPMRTDEESVSHDRVFYGAVNVYLQQKSRLFRKTPWLVDRLLDNKKLLGWVSRLGASVDAKELGEMTLTVLQGESGPQAKELEKLIGFLRDFQPDLVHITNTLFLGMVRRIKQELGVPVIVAAQGEDLFIGQLSEPYRSKVLAEMCARAAEADAFLVPSRFYAESMAQVLERPLEQFRIVPLGIRLEGHGEVERDERAGEDPIDIGYLARICPEKGFHLLAEAFKELARRPGGERLRLRVAGYLGEGDRAYFEEVQRGLVDAGLEDQFEHVGEVDLDGKIRFLSSLDLFSVPTVYREPKGLFALEAMANGNPVVLPDHGSFPEMLEGAPGGILVEPESVEALADGLQTLIDAPERRRELGRLGKEAVHEGYGDEIMVDRTLAVYRDIVAATA